MFNKDEDFKQNVIHAQLLRFIWKGKGKQILKHSSWLLQFYYKNLSYPLGGIFDFT